MTKRFSYDYNLDVASSGQTVRKTIELDKSARCVTHYTILSNREDLAYYRGTFSLRINRDEVTPDGYSVKKVMCWPSVPPDARLKSIGNWDAGNGIIEFSYTDTSEGLTTFAPYIITLSIEGEREE